ncbi:MAG TPA: hypothetical protein VGB77_21880, partial [Abditibacteriaceae bacterium]
GVFVSGFNLIGGNGPGDGNIISGNNGAGIYISGGAQHINGNFIGLTAGGGAALPNGQAGIFVSNSTNSIIGSPRPGGRNFIAGNAGAGIVLENSDNISLFSNWIGVSVDGNTSIPNNGGVILKAGSSHNFIGGFHPGEGNVISGNKDTDVLLTGAGTTENLLCGNIIGLLPDGQRPTTSQITATAIRLDDGANANRIGKAVLEREADGSNLIADYAVVGIHVNGVQDTIIENNHIGLKKDGQRPAMPEYKQQIGILLENGASRTRIGGRQSAGPSSPELNRIAFQVNYSILLRGETTSNNAIQFNRIGLERDSMTFSGGLSGIGVEASGNSISTVVQDAGTAIILAGSNNTVQNCILRHNLVAINVRSGTQNLVGGSQAQSNRIHANSDGIVVEALNPLPQVTIRRNEIFDNLHLGIDLLDGRGGVTPNDESDADSGPNGLQNYPVMSEVAQSAPGEPLLLRGRLNSTPNRTFAIDVFANVVAHPLSGFGEGEQYLGSFEVTTDANGNVSFEQLVNLTENMAEPLGQFISLTATDESTGDTSEFSRTVEINVSGSS